ncbi:unnamed protein product [Caenorhabditis angaria]|uniref:Uncharacterized protein n=1 Tax=Caenorhabditis angaria TaxID=860376 RepID=A0A9P1IC26_9PELO|nr:unnamed protein product [Caenorhabditis angaria]
MVRTCDSNEFSKTRSTHPATGIYPTYSSSIVDDSDSVDEYHVEFQPKKLLIPRKYKRDRGNSKVKVSEHEHSITSKCVERSVYSDETEPISYTEADSFCFRNDTQSKATVDTTRRVHLSSIFTSLVNFFQNNPRFTKFVLIGLLIYTFICNVEIFVPRIIVFLVRLLYPWCRYIVVIIEQLFNSLANIFTRLDGLIYATYCEFGAKQCRTRRLMCDVSCSFVDHILSQSRPQYSPPPPQN